MPKQLTLLKESKRTHGGSSSRGNPRDSRPLSVKRPIHVVMRSSRAVGALSFLNPNNKAKVEFIIHKHAKNCGVRIYDIANAGNHFHLNVKITSVPLFRKFLRSVTGLIARAVLRAEKTRKKLKPNQKFWDARPFTRILEWGKAFDIQRSYIALNNLEAAGFVKWSPRDGRRKVVTVNFDP